ncbi:hypothetical protein C8R47DRAFT_1299113 [Mycena vitilis]|nr:hypothetical protein C8R47DRAFT_1299113 [Mycena vitilis]
MELGVWRWRRNSGTLRSKVLVAIGGLRARKTEKPMIRNEANPRNLDERNLESRISAGRTQYENLEAIAVEAAMLRTRCPAASQGEWDEVMNRLLNLVLQRWDCRVSVCQLADVVSIFLIMHKAVYAHVEAAFGTHQESVWWAAEAAMGGGAGAFSSSRKRPSPSLPTPSATQRYRQHNLQSFPLVPAPLVDWKTRRATEKREGSGKGATTPPSANRFWVVRGRPSW